MVDRSTGWERQADFDAPGVVLQETSLTRRPDAIARDYLRAWSVGPQALADPGAGLLDRVWEARVQHDGSGGGTVYLRSANASVGQATAWLAEVALFSFTGGEIDELDLAFDQNGNVVVAAERAGRVWLYWYSPTLADFTFQNFCQGRTPRVLLDDPETSEESDALLVYVSDENDRAEVRQQRDLYNTAYPTPVTGAIGLYVEEVAKAGDNRLHVVYSRRDAAAGTYTIATLESAPYPYRFADGLALTQRLTLLDTTDVVLPAGMLPEGLAIMQRLTALNLQALILIVQPEPGADGVFPVEGLALTQRLATLDLQELVLLATMSPEGLILTQRLSALNSTVVVIEAPPTFWDGLALNQRLLSLDLQPI
jgi:hypothetical protein